MKQEIHRLLVEIGGLLALNSTRTSHYEAKLQVHKKRAKRVLKTAALKVIRSYALSSGPSSPTPCEIRKFLIDFARPQWQNERLPVDENFWENIAVE